MTFDPNVPTAGYAQPLQYASPGVKPLLPVLGRAKAATICFWCLLAAQVLMAILLLAVAVNPDMLEDESGKSGAALLLIFGLVLLGGALVFMVVSIVTVVLYCMWQYRVHANAHVMADRPLGVTPGWGVGYWFIPIINLFRPFQVMREIDGATPADDRPVDGLINAWWLTFILAIVFSIISGVLEGPDDTLTPASVTFDLLNSAMNIIGIVLIVKIIQSISRRQAAVVGS